MLAARTLPLIRTPGTAAAMIAVTTSQVGYREGANNDTIFGAWYGMNHVAWCAEFQSWSAAHSGCGLIIPKHAFTPAGVDWFRDHGRWHTGRPQLGDEAYFYNASLGRVAHVELVCKVNSDGSWLSCGGNTNNTGSREGNGVYIQRRTTTRGGGFGRPAYLPSPAVRGPVDLSNVVAKARETGIYDGRVAAALIAEGLPATVKGYAAWQKSYPGGGYSGASADGIAGLGSLTRLGKRHGWTVQA